jgi:hypothetical protein
LSDLPYALVQVCHNLGAATVAAPPVAALWLARETESRRRLAWLSTIAWAAQAATGTAFGIVSWTTKGALPELAGVALWALLLKLFATGLGLAAGAALLLRTGAADEGDRPLWATSLAAAALALGGAAFLRWYL